MLTLWSGSFPEMDFDDLRRPSKWMDLGLREIPFYLVAEFGKWTLLREVERVASLDSQQKQERVRIEGIAYWAARPASDLARPFHYWEWQEVIEGKNV